MGKKILNAAQDMLTSAFWIQLCVVPKQMKLTMKTMIVRLVKFFMTKE